MSSVHRMAILEREAGNILLDMGYEPTIVSATFQNTRYIPFNLIAHKIRNNGGIDRIIVKLKVSLHPLEPGEAEMFCHDEIGRLKKFFAQVPMGLTVSRFEVWVSIPTNMFQQFEINEKGIREVLR